MGIRVSVISGRTLNQGTSLEEGKFSENYLKTVRKAFLSPVDAEELGLREGLYLSVKTAFGEAVLEWGTDEGLERGGVFIPYGPWANLLYSPQTCGTGMPWLKTIEGEVEPTEEEPLTLEEFLERLKGVDD